MKLKKLLMITGNPGKAEEFEKLLDIEHFSVDHKPLDLLEIQSLDIEKIGYHKTLGVFDYVDEIEGYDAVLTDDTGLTCHALNNLPGPFIKWFLNSIGTDGILDLIKGKDNRTTATCLLTLGMVKERTVFQFKGDVRGKLIEARGDNGFGWDKIFLPDEQLLTYAELDSDMKNKISHRALAVKKLRKWLIS